MSFVEEINYRFFFENKVLAYYKSFSVQETIITDDGHQIVYTKFTKKNNKKAILMSPGRTEFSMKYAELVFDFRDLDFDLYLIDHRGQGDSERLLSDDQKGHISSFRDYVSDFTLFVNDVEKEKKYDKKILLAHCMGSIIGLGFAQNNPQYFDGIIITSPMFEINMKGLPELVGIGIIQALKTLGLGRKYTIGAGPFETNISFKKNRVTSCRSRYRAIRRIEKENPHYIMGGPTNDWAFHSVMGGRIVFDNRYKIKAPLLMFQAEDDDFVLRERQDQFIAEIENAEKILVKDSLHEILQEKDSIRRPVIEKIKDFLEQFS